MFVVYFLAKYLGLFFSLTFGLVVALLVVSTNQIVSISFLCTNLWFIRIKVIRPHNSSPSKCTRHNLVTSTIHQNILLQIQCSHSKKKIRLDVLSVVLVVRPQVWHNILGRCLNKHLLWYRVVQDLMSLVGPDNKIWNGKWGGVMKLRIWRFKHFSIFDYNRFDIGSYILLDKNMFSEINQ
jgi:hypothetical protein